jgi:hypothetical protein
MTITNHAKQRSQQRGIPLSGIDLVMLFGTPIRRPGGAIEYVLLKKDKVKLIEFFKNLVQVADKLEGKAILTSGDTVVTAYHKKDNK